MQTEFSTPCVYVPRAKAEFRPFVYGLVDPLDISHVRYVGMSTANAKRPYHHVKDARNPLSAPTHKVCWIRKLLAEGREPAVLILEELSQTAPDSLVCFVEQSYIASLKSIGHDLVNGTDGGDGHLNPTPRVREILSRNAKARHASGSLGIRGKHHSEASKKLSRDANILAWERKTTEERDAKEAKRLATLAAASPEKREAYRINRSAAGIAKATPEYRARLSASVSATMTPEHRAELSRLTSASMTPEHRKVQSQDARAAWAKKTPEQRAAHAKKAAEASAAAQTPDSNVRRAASVRATCAARNAAFALLTPSQQDDIRRAKIQRKIDRLKSVIAKGEI